MRGLKLVAVLTVAVLFLTGCGNNEKTLTCTNTEEQSGISMEQEVTMTFKEDKISYVKMSVNSKATSSLIESNWDMFASMMDEQFEERNEDGIKVTTNNDTDNHAYKVELEVDLTKTNEDALSEYGLDGITDERSTYEQTKKDAEEDGFTCK